MAFEIDLDEQSLAILKTIDPIHRFTIINMGLRLVENTEFYNLLTGKIKSDDVTGTLDIDRVISKPEEPTKPNPTTTWDNF
jgi:hypothetical protein